jgi:hypothetical protein
VTGKPNLYGLSIPEAINETIDRHRRIYAQYVGRAEVGGSRGVNIQQRNHCYWSGDLKLVYRTPGAESWVPWMSKGSPTDGQKLD